MPYALCRYYVDIMSFPPDSFVSELGHLGWAAALGECGGSHSDNSRCAPPLPNRMGLVRGCATFGHRMCPNANACIWPTTIARHPLTICMEACEGMR